MVYADPFDEKMQSYLEKLRNNDYAYIKVIVKSSHLTKEQKVRLFHAYCTMCPEPIIKMVEMFLKNSIDVNTTDNAGSNALNAIARNPYGEHMNIVKFLVENGATPFAMQDLRWKAKQDGVSIRYDVDTQISNHSYSKTPYEQAILHNKLNMAAYLREAEFAYLQNQHSQTQNDKMMKLIIELQDKNARHEKTIENQTKQSQTQNDKMMKLITELQDKNARHEKTIENQTKQSQTQNDKMMKLITELQDKNARHEKTIENQTKQIDELNKRVGSLDAYEKPDTRADRNERDNKKIGKLARIIAILINDD